MRMNEQFISRNRFELSQVISEFRETTAVYQDNLSLYLDRNYWEVFDLRIGKTIFRHEFKHIKTLIDDLRRFRDAISEVSLIKFRIDKLPSRHQSACYRYLQRFYDNQQILYFV